MKKIMLIAGCSHASGSEIDGTEDSVYNRQKSYGNQLAIKMGYTPINIADPGANNPSIARTILQWFNEEYVPEEMDVFVLVSWTECTRMDVPVEKFTDYHREAADYNTTVNSYFARIIFGWTGATSDEKAMIPGYHRFMAENEKYLQVVSANLILQIQYFLKLKNIDYLMCNTLHMFTKRDNHTSFYMDQIDTSKYFNMENNEESFHPKYKSLGYKPSANWHHGEIPHTLYAEELHNFIKETYVFN